MNKTETTQSIESLTPKYDRKHTIALRVLHATMFISSLGYSIIIPMIWPYVKLINPDAQKKKLGYVVAMFSIGQILGSLSFGFLVNCRKSFKQPLIFSILLICCGHMLYANILVIASVNTGIYLLMFGRLITGFGSGNVAIIRTYVTGFTSHAEKSSQIAIMSACQGLGYIIGPSFQTVLSTLGYPGAINTRFIKLNRFTGAGFVGIITNIINVVLILFLFDDRQPESTANHTFWFCKNIKGKKTTEEQPISNKESGDIGSVGRQSMLIKNPSTISSLSRLSNTVEEEMTSQSTGILKESKALHAPSAVVKNKSLRFKREPNMHDWNSLIISRQSSILKDPSRDLKESSVVLQNRSKTINNNTFKPKDKKPQLFTAQFMGDRENLTDVGKNEYIDVKIKDDQSQKENVVQNFILNFLSSNSGKDYLMIVFILMLFFSATFLFSSYETILTPLLMDNFSWTLEQVQMISSVTLSSSGVIGIITFISLTFTTKIFSDRSHLVIGIIFCILTCFVNMPFWGPPPPIYKGTVTVPGATAQSQTFGCPLDLQPWCATDPALTLPRICIATLFFTIGYSISNVSTTKLYAVLLGSGSQASMMGIFTAVGSLAQVIGPIYISNVYGLKGMIFSFGVLAVFYTFLLLLVIVFYIRLNLKQ